MTEPRPDQDAARRLRLQAGRSRALSLFIMAAVLLYYGFGMSAVSASSSSLHQTSVWFMGLAARGLGIALLLTAGAQLTGARGTARLAALVEGLTALVCGATGLIWLLHGDMLGLIMMVMALLCGSGAMTALQDARREA